MQQITGNLARTKCYGRLLELKNWGGGWIEPLQEIDHPAARWNRGHVYLTRRDVRPGFDLQPGDIVAFHLYADKKGLGAEDVFPVRMPPGSAFPAAQAQMAMTEPSMSIAPLTPPMKPPPGLDKPGSMKASGRKGTDANPGKLKAPIYKPSLCEALGFTDDEPAPIQKQPRQLWATSEVKPPASDLSLGPPPGFAPIRDNFSVNLSLLTDSDDEDEDDDESAEVDSYDTAKTISDEADERADGSQSLCGSFSLKSNLGDASTNAGYSDDRTSVADSDKVTSYPTTPATPAKCVLALAKGLGKITAAEVFSDDDEEPAREPTPGCSRTPSPEGKEIAVPDPAPSQNKILPVGFKIYMI